MKSYFDELKELFTNATAAEAEVTGKHQKDVAREWAWQYAIAALEMLPQNKATRNITAIVRAPMSLEAPYEPVKAFYNLLATVGASQPKKRPVRAPVAFGGSGKLVGLTDALDALDVICIPSPPFYTFYTIYIYIFHSFTPFLVRELRSRPTRPEYAKLKA